MSPWIMVAAYVFALVAVMSLAFAASDADDTMEHEWSRKDGHDSDS